MWLGFKLGGKNVCIKVIDVVWYGVLSLALVGKTGIYKSMTC